MENKPLVSVIIPTYNYARFICGAIDSVLSSNFPQNQLEIIVIDDGSTDETLEKITSYKDKVKYIAQENAGKASATRVGISHARGEYLFNLDADDLFLPNKIQQVVDVFERDKDIVHVAHPAIYWDFNNNTKTIEFIPNIIAGSKICGKKLLSYFYQKRILFGGGSTFSGRTAILKKLNIKKEVDMFIDEYLVMFTLSCGYSLFIEQPLSIWRIHGDNFSNIKSDINLIEAKMQRRLNSMDAVLDSLSDYSFQEDIKRLYLLNLKVSKIVAQEELGKKSILDIIDMWRYIVNNSVFFKYHIFDIIKNYTILNRSLPTSILRLLKQVKVTLAK